MFPQREVRHPLRVFFIPGILLLALSENVAVVLQMVLLDLPSMTYSIAFRMFNKEIGDDGLMRTEAPEIDRQLPSIVQ